MTKEDHERAAFGFDIQPFFKESCFKGFEDNVGGFYQVYRDAFEKLKAEEEKAWKLRDKEK
jgi:hypothetical protein